MRKVTKKHVCSVKTCGMRPYYDFRNTETRLEQRIRVIIREELAAFFPSWAAYAKTPEGKQLLAKAERVKAERRERKVLARGR